MWRFNLSLVTLLCSSSLWLHAEIKTRLSEMDAEDVMIVKDAEFSSLAGLAAGSSAAQGRQKKMVQQGWPLEIKTKVAEISMRLIPAGRFVMGSPPHEKGRYHHERRHWVTLTKPFYMGKFEITQQQWQEVMGEDIKACMKKTNHTEFAGIGDHYPVYYVSWEDAELFVKMLCQRLNVPEGTYRLPTEAEWEYACRAGTETVFYFGDSLTSSQANFDGTFPYRAIKGVRRGKATAVGLFQANAWGVFDMHGNVWEWCLDNFEPYSPLPAVDPMIRVKNSFRVYRGGCWYRLGDCCRSANRNGYSLDYRNNNVGFRIVRVIDTE